MAPGHCPTCLVAMRSAPYQHFRTKGRNSLELSHSSMLFSENGAAATVISRAAETAATCFSARHASTTSIARSGGVATESCERRSCFSADLHSNEFTAATTFLHVQYIIAYRRKRRVTNKKRGAERRRRRTLSRRHAQWSLPASCTQPALGYKYSRALELTGARETPTTILRARRSDVEHSR